MNKTKQQIAIAEACGWSNLQYSDYKPLGKAQLVGRHPGGSAQNLLLVPDYLNDLNAMHEAEKALTDEQFFSYGEHLDKITLPEDKMQMCYVAWPEVGMYRELICATAAQRAEAFLKTLNLWEDE